jgi:MarR-like DNA-binding transcriptional regulator SgrR of sgrS sRNA
MDKNKRRILCFILINLIMLLTGCNGREAFIEVEGVVTVTPAIDKQIKQIDGGPAQGGTIYLPVTPIDTLNPYKTNNRFVSHIALFIYEPLFTQADENNVEPCLVNTWENYRDTIWTFTIRDDVFFHDGSKLTALDVAYSFDMLEASDSLFYNTGIFDNIDQINVSNKDQLEIQLIMPDPMFVNKLVFPIVPRSTPFSSDEILPGTGPYLYNSVDETAVTLKRNDQWWQSPPPYLDTIVFRVLNENEMLDAFQNNQIDVTFIKNVDFSKYQYRTDISYQVYPDNEGNFIYVNPKSLFGQSNRQDALFRYITSRLHDMNLGQVQYFDEYSENPVDVDGFRNELIASGLHWDDVNKMFFQWGTALRNISIVVPEKDLQKLHTANFLVNILSDAGLSAEIKTVSPQHIKTVIRSGTYDLAPITEVLYPWEPLEDTLARIQGEFGYGMDISYILPLYRNQQAILYKKYIRGEKKAIYWNPYQGFQSWYLPVYVESALED